MDLLECHDAEMVSKCMRLFVPEVRKADGEPYPPSTIRGLLSGLNRVIGLRFFCRPTLSLCYLFQGNAE